MSVEGAGAERFDDEAEGVLDISEQTNRPIDDALRQQRIQAWHPILHPVWVIASLLYLGVILVPVGFKLDSMQTNDVVELNLVYDEYTENYTVDEQLCGIGDNFNAGKTCTVSFMIPKNMSPPILVYYQLTNFHQNYRSYVSSRDDKQLSGYVGSQDSVSAQRCSPLNQLGNITLNPCGTVANTFFNDIITLTTTTNNMTMREDGIAWASDLEYLFNQPQGFFYETCPGNFTTAETCSASDCCKGVTSSGEPWSCLERGPYFDTDDGLCYRYFYPNDNTTQYLYETYPNIISPLEGVENEHFVVWMRVAAQPTFRKLYGWIEEPIVAGQEITFNITANYVVTRFRGSKSIILTTTTRMGGKNIYLGPIFYWVGFFCLFFGILFAIKQTFRPRKLADRSYLHFKVD